LPGAAAAAAAGTKAIRAAPECADAAPATRRAFAACDEAGDADAVGDAKRVCAPPPTKAGRISKSTGGCTEKKKGRSRRLSRQAAAQAAPSGVP